jgi:hypothetical protein
VLVGSIWRLPSLLYRRYAKPSPLIAATPTRARLCDIPQFAPIRSIPHDKACPALSMFVCLTQSLAANHVILLGAMGGNCTRYGTDSSTSHVARRLVACMPLVEYRAPSCQCRVTVHDAIACASSPMRPSRTHTR